MAPSENLFFSLHRPEQCRKTRKNRSRVMISNIYRKHPLILMGVDDFLLWCKVGFSLEISENHLKSQLPPNKIGRDHRDIFDIRLRDRFFRVFRQCSGLSSKKNHHFLLSKKNLSPHTNFADVQPTISVDMVSTLAGWTSKRNSRCRLFLQSRLFALCLIFDRQFIGVQKPLQCFLFFQTPFYV